MAAKLSTAPWNGAASGYTDEQWERATILDRGPDFSTAKTRYGLPIREPDGTLNRKGMASAATSLSGGRTPIKAGTSEKAAARNRLQHAYQEVGLTLKSDLQVPIWKDDENQIVYGVVLQPGVEDSQGDILSAGEIEKAAHRFLVESRKSDIQHNEQQADVTTVESYVAPHEMVVGGRPVLKGSWVMASHVADSELWASIKKGDLTGYSIGATGIRKAEDESLAKAHELTNLDVEWVSLVDRAAVRDPIEQSEPMRFLVYKRDNTDLKGSTMTEDELTKALAKAEAEKAELAEALEKAKSKEAPKFGTPEWEAMYGKKAKATKTENGEDDEGDGDDDDNPVNKSDLDPKVRAALEKAESDRQEMAERLEKAEEMAKAEREVRLTKEFIAKAESYKALPIKASDFGLVLKEASANLSSENYEALEKALLAADEAIEKGDLFAEHGRGGEGKVATALDEVQRKAEELRKADSDLSEADAFEKALKSDRGLEARYLSEVSPLTPTPAGVR